MLVSIHLPKTAGTTFGQLLQKHLGHRLMMDYGDWVGWETSESLDRRRIRVAEMRARSEELSLCYDAIHGHFIADKYIDLFPSANFIAFVRDPYQQAVSNYEYILRNPLINHPAVQYFHREKLTLIDFIRWDMRRNPQSLFLGSIQVTDLTMVGITEQFSRSLALFNKIFDWQLTNDRIVNSNPIRQTESYNITSDIRAAVDESCETDLELYRKSVEVFSQLLKKWDA